ncbi:hypothetical protein ACFL3V_00215 [Nanoarchaeota archaeon]
MASSKKIKKFSKSTLGTGVETVADYVDIFSQMVTEYFNQRYKIKKKVEDVKKGIQGALYSLKREFLKSMVEALFLFTGLAALIVGLVLFLNRYVPLEYVFLGYGFLVTIIVLIKTKLKA